MNKQDAHPSSDLVLFGQNVERFKCGQCATSFNQLDALMRHNKKHRISSKDQCSIPSILKTNEEDKIHPVARVIESKEQEVNNFNLDLRDKRNSPLLQEICNEFLSDEDSLFLSNDLADKSDDLDEKSDKELGERKHNKTKAVTSKGNRSAKKSYTGELYPGPHPYKCSYCDKRFKQVGHVNLHERTHTGGQKYICPYCNKKFNQLSHLKDHERIHTGERPFMCSDCGKCFGYNSALKSHKKIHTGEKTYKCGFCEKTFNQLGNLRTHERLHTGELKYMCSECGKCYNTRSNLTRHSCNNRPPVESGNVRSGKLEDQLIREFETQDQKMMM